MSYTELKNIGKANEYKVYYKDSSLLTTHREDGPAMEYKNGLKFWYTNGSLHREDGPAIEWLDGSYFWYKNGRLHRDGGPAIKYTDGSLSWYKNGQRHREDGPAVEYVGGYKEYYLNDFCYYSENSYWDQISKKRFGDFV